MLLHAAMIGDSKRFTRQDGVEETWRIMQPLLDSPPPVHPYAKGSWGPAGGRRARWRAPAPGTALGGVMSPAKAKNAKRAKTDAKRDGKADGKAGAEAAAAAEPQSAAAPSPFPPIADYAFLSNCHTGALVAPDGAIDWLCVPRFDSPSIFGTLLDRQAGAFRLGPVRDQRAGGAASTSPARTSCVTTWHTPTGWVMVRDALTMGPRRGEDEITPHTRPPTDEDAEHMLVRTVAVPGRQRRDRADVRAGLRLRARPGRVDAERGPPHGRRHAGPA